MAGSSPEAGEFAARHHLSIESWIWPFLPRDWAKGPGSGTITFWQLLTHRAAFRHALGSFLSLTVTALAGGAGVDQALDDAARNIQRAMRR